MVRKKVVIEFRPNKDNPRHLLLHKYLCSLDSGISGAILEAIDDKFLPIATVNSGASLFDIRIACKTSIAKHKAQIEITQGILETVESQLVQGDLRSILAPDPNVSSDADEDDDDSWDDDDELIPSEDFQFKGERN